MSAATSLQALVERYLVERRRLGFALRSPAYALRGFARHVQAVGHRGPLTVELMVDWARSDSHGSWARRLKSLRSFTRWMQQFEPRTEVPDDAIFGRMSERLTPHIYSEQEIVDLLAAARRLGPAPGLRGALFEALFGLIACTGLRISEALALRNTDVDLRHGMLTILQTKFAKSRQVPMHPSAVQALRRYRSTCDRLGEFAQEEAPFFFCTRGRRRGLPLGERQAGKDRRFSGGVVRRIVLWQAQEVDIDQAMLSLSTYVGHAKATNTYWYLTAVPELMSLAAERFELFKSQPEVPDA